jgi:hypothetical protein
MEFIGIQLQAILEQQASLVGVYDSAGSLERDVDPRIAVKLVNEVDLVGIGHKKRIRYLRPRENGLDVGGSKTIFQERFSTGGAAWAHTGMKQKTVYVPIGCTIPSIPQAQPLAAPLKGPDGVSRYLPATPAVPTMTRIQIEVTSRDRGLHVSDDIAEPPEKEQGSSVLRMAASMVNEDYDSARRGKRGKNYCGKR